MTRCLGNLDRVHGVDGQNVAVCLGGDFGSRIDASVFQALQKVRGCALNQFIAVHGLSLSFFIFERAGSRLDEDFGEDLF